MPNIVIFDIWLNCALFHPSRGKDGLTDYRGDATGERFVAYPKDALMQTLKPGDNAAMDSLGGITSQGRWKNLCLVSAISGN